MQWLVEVGLSNALAAIALALVAWVVGRIGRRPAVTHALWVLVLLKLLTPPVFELPLPVTIARTAAFDLQALDVPERDVAALPPSVRRESAQIRSHASTHGGDFAPQPAAQGNRSVRSAAIANAEKPASEPTLSVVAQTLSTPRAQTPGVAASPSVDEDPAPMVPARLPADSLLPSSTASWGQIAAMVWLIGLVAWVALQVLLALRLRAMLRASSPAPVELREAAEQIALRMGLRRCPQTRIIAGTGSPMLYGVGPRVSILIPAALLRRLGPEAQATVLAHELAHYWRGDQWVRLVEVVVTGLYWWLPIVWWARQQIEIAEEHCCDAHVIENSGGKTRVYAEALLDIVDLISEPAGQMRPAMSSSIGHRRLLQKRLVDLMRRRCVPTMTPVTRRMVVASGAVCLLCHPALFVTEMPTVRAATANVSRVPLLAARSPRRPTTLQTLSKSELTSPAPTAAARQPPPDSSPSQPAQAERNVWATAISPNGRHHITVSRGYECELREVTSNQVRSLTGHQITCVAFTPDSTRFITGDVQGTVRLWNTGSGEVVRTLTQREGAVHSVCIAPSGDQAAAAGEDGVVELVSLTSPGDRHVLARLVAPVRCARFSPGASRLAVVTDTWRTTAAATVAVFDVASRARLQRWETPGSFGVLDFPAEDLLITIDWNGRAHQWALPTLYRTDLPPIAKELVSAASFSADSRVLEDLSQHTLDRF
jgi:beta-lactamase regulating signal transducer with metallopeptidase domain